MQIMSRNVRSHREQPTAEQAAALRASFADDCKRAAAAIKSAHILILHTGAGFSADSGLKVYKDVADVEPYRQRGLTYAEIATPDYRSREPDVFYGFWCVRPVHCRPRHCTRC
jgi:hypothetical protein